MRAASKILIPVAVLLFLWAVVSIILVPIESGDAYPRYSSLRPDPFGAKVLYESLAAMPGVTVERSYRDLLLLPLRPAPTVLVLGGMAPTWISAPENVVKRWEAIASRGARLVFVFQPSLPALTANFDLFQPDKKKPQTVVHKAAITERWGVKVKLREVTAKERAQISRSPRESAAYFEADGSWTVVERHSKDGLPMQIEKRMGQGSIVIATQLFRLSNEGLREERHGAWIASLLGPNTRIVFDEFHHNVQDTDSIGTLLRRYRLQGAVGVLSFIALLFIWRNVNGLLPPRSVAAGKSETSIAGWDAQQGLTALLERSVAQADLIPVALQEWKKTEGLRPPVSHSRVQAATEAAERWKESPAAAYQEIHRILTERK
ncbi:hypothetical protein F183_A48360 [Bryobacterales bacterium F-183]|nr:hypothetical protein F183_A48360 [Bryobacterales bacterium F-183]